MSYYVLLSCSSQDTLLRADTVERANSASAAVSAALGYDKHYARLVDVGAGAGWAWEIQPHRGRPSHCYHAQTPAEAVSAALRDLMVAGYIYIADDLRSEAQFIRGAIDTDTMTANECAEWIREADALDALAAEDQS